MMYTGKHNLDRLIKEIADFDISAAYSLYVNNTMLNDSDDFDEAMSKWGIKVLPEGKSKWSDVKAELESRRKKYHKHRDLMIQLANDKGTRIQFLNSSGSWQTISNACFLDDIQYRVTEEPPISYLSYRLYFDNNNLLNAWTNKNIDPANLYEWHGDWVKTDIILTNKEERNAWDYWGMD